MDLTRLDSYNYDFNPALIAYYPRAQRDECALLTLKQKSSRIKLEKFKNITDYFKKGDILVLNDTKVYKARVLFDNKELFFLKSLNTRKDIWRCLARPGKKFKKGGRFEIQDFQCGVLDVFDDGARKIRFSKPVDYKLLDEIGRIPLPPYIKRESEIQDDKNYQTVFSKKTGSAASPTAGLHFTEEILNELKGKGVFIEYITLHIGAGTFKPLSLNDITKEKLHTEYYEIKKSLAARILNKHKNKLFACGTTVTRALETAALTDFKKLRGETDLFIYPPFKFKAVDALVTNFHLPKSSLLTLVCAFGGYENIMKAYKFAVDNKLRFYSYGDAMLIL